MFCSTLVSDLITLASTFCILYATPIMSQPDNRLEKHNQKLRNYQWDCELCGHPLRYTQNALDFPKIVFYKFECSATCVRHRRIQDGVEYTATDVASPLYYHSDGKFACVIHGCSKTTPNKKMAKSSAEGHANKHKNQLCGNYWYCNEHQATMYFVKSECAKHISVDHGSNHSLMSEVKNWTLVGMGSSSQGQSGAPGASPAQRVVPGTSSVPPSAHLPQRAASALFMSRPGSPVSRSRSRESSVDALAAFDSIVASSSVLPGSQEQSRGKGKRRLSTTPPGRHKR